MDEEGDGTEDVKRRSRNLSEKKRRDQFNKLVTELGTLVTSSTRKMDKTTILKTTITFLRNHNEVTLRSRAYDVQEDWKPAFLTNEEFTFLVLEALEGFVMVFSTTGKIYYVSESITSLLGYNPVDVVNKSIFELTFEEDNPNLYNLLQRNERAIEQTQNISTDKDVIAFQIKMKRGALDLSEEGLYDRVHFHGHFRINRSPNENEEMFFQQEQDSRVLFVCIGRLATPQLLRDVSQVDANRSEFTSRYSLEWKFLFLDHRAPPIIGYLPFEVLGTSGFDYYHFDDLEKIVSCHRALMEKGEMTSCHYRFLTKGQKWIWLQSRFYITYHQWNSKPEFVVCTHRVISHSEAMNSMKPDNMEECVTDAVDVNQDLKETVDEVMPMSPAFMEQASGAFDSQYQPNAENVLEGQAGEGSSAGISPSYVSETASDTYGNFMEGQITASTSQTFLSCDRCEPPERAQPSSSKSKDNGDKLDILEQLMVWNLATDLPNDGLLSLSPSFNMEVDACGSSYLPSSQTASMKSCSSAAATAGAVGTPCTASTAGTSGTADTSGMAGTSGVAGTSGTAGTVVAWGRDHGSVSGESQCIADREMAGVLRASAGRGGSFAEENVIEVEDDDVVVVENNELARLEGVMPMCTQPVLTDTEAEEQLQRKHEELQELIVRQQEQLRVVKEQLLMARFGILHPFINHAPIPYVSLDEIQIQHRLPQLAYRNEEPLALLDVYPPISPHSPQSPEPPHSPPMP